MFFNINCVLSISLNIFANLFLKRPTNFANLSSSLNISDERPKLNPPSAAILDSGIPNARYNFF